jgi:hypothetical protein
LREIKDAMDLTLATTAKHVSISPLIIIINKTIQCIKIKIKHQKSGRNKHLKKIKPLIRDCVYLSITNRNWK